MMRRKKKAGQGLNDTTTIVSEGSPPLEFVCAYKGFIIVKDDDYFYASTDDNPLAKEVGGVHHVRITMKSETQEYIEAAIDRFDTVEAVTIITPDGDMLPASTTGKGNRAMRFIMEYYDYHLVRWSNLVFGVPKALGTVDLSNEHLRKHPDILYGERVEQVQTLIDKLHLLDKLQQWYELNKE
ncbi:hypothetical protein JW960_02130 [candidate division KSB1 bacterium]|nr:hypothetical protein [candidate division KSB1 bacterium]